MKIDLMGSVVKIDELSLDDDLEISNGTIILTGDLPAIQANKLHKTKIYDINAVAKTRCTKWQYIKCCLRLAWEEVFKE